MISTDSSCLAWVMSTAKSVTSQTDDRRRGNKIPLISVCSICLIPSDCVTWTIMYNGQSICTSRDTVLCFGHFKLSIGLIGSWVYISEVSNSKVSEEIHTCITCCCSVLDCGKQEVNSLVISVSCQILKLFSLTFQYYLIVLTLLVDMHHRC